MGFHEGFAKAWVASSSDILLVAFVLKSVRLDLLPVKLVSINMLHAG